MVRNSQLLKDFEESFIARSRLSHEQAFRLYDSMWEEAVQLGVMPPKDPWEGVDVDIRLARILHACSKKSSPQ